uniref:Membrane protein, putative n=1 Tax=Babesia bovis TaxID=5865 RepID=A7AWK4_BABBO|eukprot:XP_001609000.1 hypothetical protein [Babesia bovis T2Bo]
MLKFTWLTLIVLSFPNKLAISVDYRSWYTPAQNTYKRGKSVYEDIIKSANDREEECVILHSSDRQLATMQYGTGSGGQFPCINQLQRGSNRSLFDINANVDEMAGPTRKDRVIAEGGCWQFVLNQINALDIDKCDIKGEVSRSLIALAKTKCHFIRSRRAFPLAEHGCILNPESVDDKSLGIFNEEYETNPCRDDYSSAECRKLKEDIVAQCTNLRIMSESAFQMYHADLNHIDDICFYLQSNDWNRRTESNVSLTCLTNTQYDTDK